MSKGDNARALIENPVFIELMQFMTERYKDALFYAANDEDTLAIKRRVEVLDDVVESITATFHENYNVGGNESE